MCFLFDKIKMEDTFAGDKDGSPADQKVLFHCQQLMTLACHVAHLINRVKSHFQMDKKMSISTSSETAASPGATLCKWTNGRRKIRAKYCKEAWRGEMYTFLHNAGNRILEPWGVG